VIADLSPYFASISADGLTVHRGAAVANVIAADTEFVPVTVNEYALPEAGAVAATVTGLK
jgi:hypothetical protein